MTRKTVFHTVRVWLSLMLLALVCLSLLACSGVGYYRHLAEGQYRLWQSQVPVQRLIDAEATPAELRHKLQLAQRARVFAAQVLKLDPGDSYLHYADTGRPYVVWNLMAAPPLALTPEHWCYPLVGCQSYRGYFDLRRARDDEAELIAQGLDTYLGGVSAYSTLGWLDDPLLNTFIFRTDDDLAALLFHELAHKVVYVKGDTRFNESFATAVEQLGLQQWQAQAGSIATKASPDRLRWQAAFLDLIETTVAELRQLYGREDLTVAQKLQEKEAVIARLKSRHTELTRELSAPSPYEHWFNSPINNAKLLTVTNYHQWVPAFVQLWHDEQGNWQNFYRQVVRLGDTDPSQRDATLAELDRRARLAAAPSP